MDLQEFVEQFPDFQLVLEDELLLQGGRDVMWGRTYSRRKTHQEVQGAKSPSS